MHACAYIVGPLDGPGKALHDLAVGLGFPRVQGFASIGAAELQTQKTPLLFFMFAAVPQLGAMQRVAESIRFSPSRRIRFSPMIYFAESPSLDVIRACIDMGFDDVITMPFTHRRIEERIERLVDHTQVYFETSAYLGPDRRPPDETEGGQYRRLEIVRSALYGVNVLSDEVRVTL